MKFLLNEGLSSSCLHSFNEMKKRTILIIIYYSLLSCVRYKEHWLSMRKRIYCSDNISKAGNHAKLLNEVLQNTGQ